MSFYNLHLHNNNAQKVDWAKKLWQDNRLLQWKLLLDFSKKEKIVEIHTLWPVNDVTEGSTQEANMEASLFPDVIR